MYTRVFEETSSSSPNTTIFSAFSTFSLFTLSYLYFTNLYVPQSLIENYTRKFLGNVILIIIPSIIPNETRKECHH